MNNFLSQLNLTAQERRIVVIIFLVFFVVLNYLFVWPSFGEWGNLTKQRLDMLDKIAKYNRVINQDYATNGWKMQVEELTKREGGSGLERPVNPQVQLQNTIRAQERKTGVYIKSLDPRGSVKTNEFFEEQSTAISLECQEPQLVGFLYHMGLDPAMIRVTVLNLKPADNNRYRLQAQLTLTANYAKKPPAAVVESAADKHAAGAKPGGAPSPKPGAVASAKSLAPEVVKPRGAPLPFQGPGSKRPPGGLGAPGSNRQGAAGKNPPMPSRPGVRTQIRSGTMSI